MTAASKPLMRPAFGFGSEAPFASTAGSDARDVRQYQHSANKSKRKRPEYSARGNFNPMSAPQISPTGMKHLHVEFFSSNASSAIQLASNKAPIMRLPL